MYTFPRIHNLGEKAAEDGASAVGVADAALEVDVASSSLLLIAESSGQILALTAVSALGLSDLG